MAVPNRARFTLLVSLFAACVGSRSRAQDASVCAPPAEFGPIEVTPASGAALVPLRAVIRVRYSDAYFAGSMTPTETVTLSSAATGAVAGRVELAGDDTLYFVPAAPLRANTQYTGSASGAAFPFTFSFTTSASQDVDVAFGDPHGASGFEVEASSADPDCFEAGSRRVRLSFPSAAVFGGPASSTEYWVYLTRGEGVDAPELVTRVRDFGATVTTVGFVLRREVARRPACVMVVAVDGLDRGEQWSKPVCFDPQNGAGFVSLCSTSPRASATASRMPAWAAFVLLSAVAARVRRRSPLKRARGRAPR